MMNTRAALLASAFLLVSAAASADEYTDLLDILKAKGSLTQSEYSALMAKHMHNARAAATAHKHGRETTPLYTAAPDEEAAAQARQAALSAAASAAAADAAMRKAESMQTEMEADPGIVHAMPYKLGSGVTIRVGQVDLNVSGIVNGYYTFSSAASATPGHVVDGGLADASGFDSSAVRNGLLPGAIILSASTTQAGIDISAVFGAYPGLNSASVGLLNANNGGTATALGTSGVDFRKTYITFGTKDVGTFKIGRDIGIFGSDAILNDATLLSVGSTGGNADPANTSLGRIGIGYIYTDFMPQISYASPIFAGFQATVGAFQPLNEFNYSGDSGTATEHNTPEFEGKLTYDYKGAGFDTHIWGGFMTQPQQGITVYGVQTRNSKLAGAGEGGVKVDFGPVGLVGYGYRGTGVGTTGKFFDGVAPNGQFRDSEGYYVQGSLKVMPKLKLTASYGESSLFKASGEGVDPLLVRRNESEVAAGYYTLTDWLTLVGEYAHETDHAHGGNSANSNAFTTGAILFY